MGTYREARMVEIKRVNGYLQRGKNGRNKRVNGYTTYRDARMLEIK
jgi:hypothetical protein